MEEQGVVEEWSVKDLVGHITTWETETMRNVRRFLDTQEVTRYPDTDAFNDRTVRGKRDTPLDELLSDLERTHGDTVGFVRDLSEDVLDLPEVEWRLRIDTYEHYLEHARHIDEWLAERSSG